VLSGDDAISGSGRLNGFNNQDGKDGFNDDEAAVFRMAAVVQQSTGVKALDIVAGGHSHTGIDDSAKKDPAINKLLGLGKHDRSTSPERMAKIQKALLDGTIKGGNAKKFAVDAKGAFKDAGGSPQVLKYAISQVAGAHGGEDVKVDKNKFKASIKQHTEGGGGHDGHGAEVPGGGAGAPDVAVGGGCSMDPAQGIGALGGGPASGSIESILQQLVQTLTALVAAISSSGVAGASGGGAVVQQQPAPATPTVKEAAGHAH
jgi:hypothetical protein